MTKDSLSTTNQLTRETILDHKHKGLPDFGRIVYTQDPDGLKILEGNGQNGGVSNFKIETNPDGSVRSLSVSLPGDYETNVEWVNSDRKKSSVGQPFQVSYKAPTGGGGAIPDGTSLSSLEVTVATETQHFSTPDDLRDAHNATTYLMAIREASLYLQGLSASLKVPMFGDTFDSGKHDTEPETIGILNGAVSLLRENFSSSKQMAENFGLRTK